MPTETSVQLLERVTELEIKVSFQEDLLDKLDQIIIRQQQQIDALQHAVVDLRQQFSSPSEGSARNLRDELPPHY